LTSHLTDCASLLLLLLLLAQTFNESGVPVSVWTSTLRRTIATANYLPYPKLRWKALDEIHAVRSEFFLCGTAQGHLPAMDLVAGGTALVGP
jgi:hypothetical protein